MGRKDYEVGYGRPPKHSRFQKGQSGNPAGRRKGSSNVASLIRRALNERVVINVDGKRRKVTKLQAACMQQSNKAAAGDLKATQLMLGLLNAAEGREDAGGDAQLISPELRRSRDQALLAALRARMTGGDDAGEA